MLLTKLHISAPGAQTVHRTELFEKLVASLKAKLTLISAPAGFGKTTLVSDWILQQKIPAAWFSIDESDNDAAGFFSYIIAAVQGLNPAFGKKALNLLHSPNLVRPESIIGLIINELVAIPQHLVLVLDDFHLIQDQEVLTLFTYFVEHIPETVHVFVLSRADPLLPVAKLRSRNQLVELRASDLSFSVDEIQYLFNRKLKLKLSQHDVTALAFKTEGWIAGLQLIGISLQGREDAASYIQEFSGDNRYIMDYLIEEVLKIQPPAIKEFLIQTSLLEQLSGPLCNTMLNRKDSQEILEMLEKNNMFIISLDRERKWYRYHHLFADLLRQRLFLKEKELINQLHIKASAWFEENQLLPLSIEHLLQVQDYEKALQLLTGIIEGLWENGHHASIIKYGSLLSEGLIMKSPEFCLFYAWVLISSGQIRKASPFLVSAEKITSQNLKTAQKTGNSTQNLKKLTGKIAVALANLYTFQHKPEVIQAYCQTALENLSEEDPLWFSWAWHAVGMSLLADEKIYESTEALKKALHYGKQSGNIYLITTIGITLGFTEGRLGLYKTSYNRSAELLEFLKENGYGSLAKTDCTYAVLYANMAAIRYFWADVDGASEFVKIAYNLCLKEADITSRVLVLIVYSVVLHAQGDIPGANLKVKEAEVIMQENKPKPLLYSMFIGWKATLLIAQQELEKAKSFLEKHDVRLGKPITYTDEARYIPLAMLLLAEGKIEDAFKLLNSLYEMAFAQNRVERMIETKIYLSVIYQATGEKEKAISSLTESLMFAAPDEILMYHLNFLDQINPLLQEVFRNQATGKTKLLNAYINKLKFTIEKRKASNSGNFGLTSREQEALELMAENLSNREIADKLFISLNTVKTRLKNLYIKLEVDSRTKAVAKAKEMQLLKKV